MNADTPPSLDRDPTPWRSVLKSFASLRLTVVLFAMAIFLVFVGTLAQVDHDIWFVVEKSYFRVWFAWVEFQAFFRLAEMFTRNEAQPIGGGFWFPGGTLIGTLMAINLLAAHSIRFKVSAKGTRLARGLMVIALGIAAVVGVVYSGMDGTLESQLSPQFCEGLWQSLRAAVALLALGGAYWAVQNYGKMRSAEWSLASIPIGLLLVLAVGLFSYPEARISDAGLRILWQLSKGGGAAAVLLWGCGLAFGKRAGIVLLHGGIGLLMFGELLTGLTAKEAQMQITEGQTVSHTYDIRSTELAITTAAGEDLRETVLPESLLAQHAARGEILSHPDLPFDLRVVRFDINSRLGEVARVAKNLANQGIGLSRVALPAQSVVGVADQGVNMPSAYVEVLDSEMGESLGVWLVSTLFLAPGDAGGDSAVPQSVTVGEKTYNLDLRFRRTYKPYSLTLNDFRFDRYVGTQMAKNYSSDLILRDPSQGVDREVRVWMNNPLRYAGDTIYQASFDKGTERTTTLQVVTNGGWMIPYVSCMLVGLGMLAHFGVVLTRFTRRRADQARKAASTLQPGVRQRIEWRSPLVWAPVLAAFLCGGYLLSKAKPAKNPPGGFMVDRFAALPIAHGGRIKPIDTLARNTLQFLSARQEVLPAGEGGRKISAAQWLLDLIADRPEASNHRVFRIENLEVLESLGLEVRPGSFRYTRAEVLGDETHRAKLDEQLRLASMTPESQRTIVQKKFSELGQKLSAYILLKVAYGSPQIGTDPEKIQMQVGLAKQRAQMLAGSGAPKSVPPRADGEGADSDSNEWQTLYEAELEDLFQRVNGSETNPATAALSGLVGAYAKNDAAAFNAQVAKLEEAASQYEARLESSPTPDGLAASERLNATKISFEQFFNRFSPFYYCAATYLIAFLLTAASWLGYSTSGWTRPLARSATAIVVVTLLVHTFALVARIYISGRPPVTNLYSSAVFIGWAAVLFGLAFEAIYKLGVGNAVASVIGFASLVIAHFLSLDGDTFTVLQAVLDTQFWLATHVVCITLGYSTTFLAGFLAIYYLFAVHLPRLWGGRARLDKQGADQLMKMVYGTLCFALFFSFIGTVLGGLWADDSWGRFWGWDPKENGALIIVLWNALVLHARWGKLVGPVGLATLVVGGNIVTTWSWFGVNELGVGLHAYGANESSTTTWLLAFVVSQLAVIALGCLPLKQRPVAETAA